MSYWISWMGLICLVSLTFPQGNILREMSDNVIYTNTSVNLESLGDIVNLSFGHDVVKHAEKILKDFDPQWTLGDGFYPAKTKSAGVTCGKFTSVL
jgi:hypothetical protein